MDSYLCSIAHSNEIKRTTKSNWIKLRTCRLFIVNIAIFIAASAVFSYVSTLRFNHETLFFLFILSFKPRSNIMTASWCLNIRFEYSFAASAIEDHWWCVTIVSHRNKSMHIKLLELYRSSSKRIWENINILN